MGRKILLTLDKYCYSMHLIHFKENSMVAPDLPLPCRRGLSNMERVGWRRLGHFLGLPLVMTVCGWLAFWVFSIGVSINAAAMQVHVVL